MPKTPPTLIYSTQSHDRFFLEAEKGKLPIHYTEARLDEKTAHLAKGHLAICCFVDDDLNAHVLEKLNALGVKLILLRCTGYNNIDLKIANQFGFCVMRVAHYSPYAVAEFTMGLILMLNRKTHRAVNRTREFDFRLDGLMGFDLHGKTVGIIGTGKIGSILARILTGFGCQVIAFDPLKNSECESIGVQYVSLKTLLKESRIISLHIPLTEKNHHLINQQAFSLMQSDALLINTSRGALIDTSALITALKQKKIAGVGLDVYEEEEMYYQDYSSQVVSDDHIARLMTFPNVIITGHMAFFTEEALQDIAKTTIGNLRRFLSGQSSENNLTLTIPVDTDPEKPPTKS